MKSFMDHMAYIWIGIIVLFGIIEAATPQLTSIWFAVGALAAFFVSFFYEPVWAQIAVFMLVSAALVFATRPLAKRIIGQPVKTNVDAVIGRQAIVTADIDNDADRGLVRVDGQIWSARSESGQPVKTGEKVTVAAVRGVKLIVK